MQSSEPQDEERKHNVVLDMADDRNIVEDIQFDIFEFLESQNSGKKKLTGIRYDTPPAIVRYKMEDIYLVPKLASVNMFGEVVLKFSSTIFEPNFDKISLSLS